MPSPTVLRSFGERDVRLLSSLSEGGLNIEVVTYRFVTLSGHNFFGYSATQLLDTPVQIAERDKAIADGRDHPECSGGVSCQQRDCGLASMSSIWLVCSRTASG